MGAESAGDDVHGGISEDAARRQNQQDVAQVRLVFAVKLEPLNPVGEISADDTWCLYFVLPLWGIPRPNQAAIT